MIEREMDLRGTKFLLLLTNWVIQASAIANLKKG